MEIVHGQPHPILTSHTANWHSVILPAALLLFVASGYGEDGSTVKVCIPQHTASDAMMHQVASSLSGHKPDKSTHTRTEGVQLANIEQILDTDNLFKGNLAKQNLSTEASTRAIQEHCDYVLVISLPDVRTARSPQPNAWSPDQPSTTNTGDPYMRRQDPDYYVQIKYRLYRADPASPPLDGFIATHNAAPPQAVVAQALDMLANQVFTKVAK